MDEQLRNLIEGAKKQGATDNDVKKIIDMYILDQKKKDLQNPSHKKDLGYLLRELLLKVLLWIQSNQQERRLRLL